MKTGIELITEERKRQIDIEGWTTEHDDEHEDSELSRAAAVYATPDFYREILHNFRPLHWPWDITWWKPTPDDRIKELVKAGALIAAEIDRLQRKF